MNTSLFDPTQFTTPESVLNELLDILHEYGFDENSVELPIDLLIHPQIPLLVSHLKQLRLHNDDLSLRLLRLCGLLMNHRNPHIPLMEVVLLTLRSISTISPMIFGLLIHESQEILNSVCAAIRCVDQLDPACYHFVYFYLKSVFPHLVETSDGHHDQLFQIFDLTIDHILHYLEIETLDHCRVPDYDALSHAMSFLLLYLHGNHISTSVQHLLHYGHTPSIFHHSNSGHMNIIEMYSSRIVDSITRRIIIPHYYSIFKTLVALAARSTKPHSSFSTFVDDLTSILIKVIAYYESTLSQRSIALATEYCPKGLTSLHIVVAPQLKQGHIADPSLSFIYDTFTHHINLRLFQELTAVHFGDSIFLLRNYVKNFGQQSLTSPYLSSQVRALGMCQWMVYQLQCGICELDNIITIDKFLLYSTLHTFSLLSTSDSPGSIAIIMETNIVPVIFGIISRISRSQYAMFKLDDDPWMKILDIIPRNCLAVIALCEQVLDDEQQVIHILDEFFTPFLYNAWVLGLFTGLPQGDDYFESFLSSCFKGFTILNTHCIERGYSECQERIVSIIFSIIRLCITALTVAPRQACCSQSDEDDEDEEGVDGSAIHPTMSNDSLDSSAPSELDHHHQSPSSPSSPSSSSSSSPPSTTTATWRQLPYPAKYTIHPPPEHLHRLSTKFHHKSLFGGTSAKAGGSRLSGVSGTLSGQQGSIPPHITSVSPKHQRRLQNTYPRPMAPTSPILGAAAAGATSGIERGTVDGHPSQENPDGMNPHTYMLNDVRIAENTTQIDLLKDEENRTPLEFLVLLRSRDGGHPMIDSKYPTTDSMASYLAMPHLQRQWGGYTFLQQLLALTSTMMGEDRQTRREAIYREVFDGASSATSGSVPKPSSSARI